MSILIHDVSMPKKGESGRIAILLGSDGIADIYNFCGTRLGKYICECSVIELPPHGRLGDLDALFQAMFQTTDGRIIGDKSIDGWPFEMPYAEIKRFIRYAPTIIPADPDGGADG